MKKKMKLMTALVLTIMLLAAMCVTSFADGNVTYEGNAKKFIFAPGSKYSPTDLFTDFKNVMPGDELTQQVVIKNAARRSVTVRIYMRALGAQEGSEEFLSQMTLTVSSNKELFNAPTDQTAQLTDWVCLGEFSSGAEVTLDVTLNVPITMGNDFQNDIGYLDWEFKAEEIPTSVDGSTTPVRTGDTMRLGLLAATGVACLIAIVIVIRLEKRKNRENYQ